ncbi:MAG: pyrrolysine--tRNA(Pyl) ligase large subunit, partial [Desulfamplus sp.]|nr:pyrrolysine--tRNA(Pyl) ligase large subunit [Desulfamplus sp.]
EREEAFQKMEKKQVGLLRKKLTSLLEKAGPTRMDILKKKLEGALFNLGFTRVSTPSIITKSAMERMTIDGNHPLFKQIFWLDEKRCLRPMLAPGLYTLMHDLGRISSGPVRIYEMGPCFRKESQGALHSSEFTMLNLVEMGIPGESRLQRLKELALVVTKTAGAGDVGFQEEISDVYGTTLDIVARHGESGTVELGSGAMGPHDLDPAWGITDTWVGMGFGIERLLMISAGDTSMARWRKSLSFLDGIPLKI